MKNRYTVLSAIFNLLITGGIILALIGRVLCIRNTENYSDLQPELLAPDLIHSVLYDEELGQLYVCYNDASYVNVYTEAGDFLWAVSTPYLRNAFFELRDGRLIVYNDDAYIYDSSDGTFIGRENAEGLGLEYSFGPSSEEEYTGEFYFDSYQVYRAASDGSLETVVSRPWWHWCFHIGVCMSIAFIGIAGKFLTILSMKRRKRLSVGKIQFTDRRKGFVCNYFRVTSAVHIVYAILNLISVFFGGILCPAIFPLGIHFLISSIILSIRLYKIRASKEERAVLEFWRNITLATFIAAFASAVIVAVCIAGK